MGYFNNPAIMGAIEELGRTNPNVVVVSQDNGALDWFEGEFPAEHFDMGISEENLIGVGAGLAHVGKLVIVLAMAPFVSMRGFEQIRDDCAYNRNNVKIIAMFTGLEAGHWGVTHHGIEDIALMRAIPGVTIIVPADDRDVYRAICAAGKIDGPVYLRIPGWAAEMSPLDGDFVIGRATTLREGTDLTLIATGTMVRTALAVHDALVADKISTRVLNMHTIKPIDREAVTRAAQETGTLLTLEEHTVIGGLGGAVAEVVAEIGSGRVVRLGVPDRFVTEIGPYPELLKLCGLDAASVESEVRKRVASS